MPLEIQFKLRENPLYIKYLRENNIWYKKLIRNPNLFSEFENEMKAKYKLRTTDKIEKIIDTIDLVSNLFNNML
jgi:hypothetical protein